MTDKNFVNVPMDDDLLRELEEMANADMVPRTVFIRRLIAKEKSYRDNEYRKQLQERLEKKGNK